MKRVLIVTPGRPGTGSGDSQRTLSIFNAVSRVAEPHVMVLYRGGPAPRDDRKGDHTLVNLFEPGGDTTWFWRKRKYFHRDYFVDRRVHRAVSALHAKYAFDAFICRYFTTAISGCDRLGPTLLDFDDLPDRMSGPTALGWHHVTWRLMLRRISGFRTVFVTKQSDVARLSHPQVRMLPCISTLCAVPANMDVAPDEPTMLFVGSCGWPPTRAGLKHFINSVLPLIRQRLPTARLRAVGGDTDSFSADGLDGAGFVDDLIPEYRRASIVVCPIYEGAGSIVKLAEAAGFGKAVVTTPHAARGFEGILEPGRDICVASSDEEMADLCVKLLSDATLRDQLGAQAHAKARSMLSQDSIDAVVGAALTDLSSER